MESFVKEIEYTLLGEMLVSQDVLNQAIQVLNYDDFTTLEIKRLYEIIIDLYKQGEKIDPLIIANKSFDSTNCKKFILQCAECVVSTANFKEHISLIKDNSKRRKALSKIQDLTHMLNDNTSIEECRTQTSEILKAYEDINESKAVKAIYGFADVIERLDKPKKYYQTGIKKIDDTAKISKSDYVIVGGRPSSGKTAFTLQMALNIAKEHNIVYFSLETTTEKIYDRLIANYTSTNMSLLKDGNLTNEQREKLSNYANNFSKLKLSVINSAGWTVEQIKAKALQLKAEVIFIDYLGLIKSDGNSQYERATRISMDLHTMAQRCGITVVALVQLNRTTGEPDMTSLRDSGQIEQDADTIMFIHNPNEKENGAIKDRQLIVAKNKEGNTGFCHLKFNGDIQKFTEVANFDATSDVRSWKKKDSFSKSS